jgi:hypothetical protein
MTSTEMMSSIAKGMTFQQRLLFAALGLLGLLFPGFVFVIVMRGIVGAIRKLTKNDAEFMSFISEFNES